MVDNDLEHRLAAYRPVVEQAMAARPLRTKSGDRRRSRPFVTAIAAGTVAAGIVGWVALRPMDDPASTGATGSVETTAVETPITITVELPRPVDSNGDGLTSYWCEIPEAEDGVALADGSLSAPEGTVVTYDEVGDSVELVRCSAEPPDAARVIAFGDSVMAGAANALGELGITVDAPESRQAGDLAETLSYLARIDVLPDTVVIHVGTNGDIAEADLDTIMDALSEVPTVVVLTVVVDRPWAAPNNELIMALPESYPNVTVLNWGRVASECPGECFATDGLHLSAGGAEYYAGLIADALRLELGS